MKIVHSPSTPCNGSFYSCEYFGNAEVPMIKGQWALPFPDEISIELTRECNLKCIHCWNNSSRRSRQELPFYLIKREIMAAPYGLHIKLTGGEPLLYTSFEELIDICNQKNILLEITSNGTLIDQKTAKYLSGKIKKLNISLHGSIASIHEKITGISGSYNKTIEGIKQMQNEAINPIINYTLMKENQEDLRGIFYLCKRLNVSGLKLLILQNCGRGKNLEKLLPDEITMLKKEAISFLGETGIHLERSEVYTIPYRRGLENADVYGCSGMRNKVFISSDAKIYPCSLFKEEMGDLNQKSLTEIWLSKEANLFRGIFVCPKEDCTLKSRCGGKCKIPNK